MNRLLRFMNGVGSPRQNILKLTKNHGALHYDMDRKSLTNKVGFTGVSVVIRNNTLIEEKVLAKAGDQKDRVLLIWLIALPVVFTLALTLIIN